MKSCRTIVASAPCRLDAGGTLDVPAFHCLLHRWTDVPLTTVTVAIEPRTFVTVRPYETGIVRVSSDGFLAEEGSLADASFRSPLGLFHAIAYYFRVDGISLEISSSLPLCGGLGGSSAAAVAAVAALAQWIGLPVDASTAALTADALESSLVGSWGLQDQLASAFGGVHAWVWPSAPGQSRYQNRQLLENVGALASNLLVAYGGRSHDSAAANGRWLDHLLSGNRSLWVQTAKCANAFARALSIQDWYAAGRALNEELALREKITPEVLDPVTAQLARVARDLGCGARFCGAGNGGCVWALGDSLPISRVRAAWEEALVGHPEARILETRPSAEGLRVEEVLVESSKE